MFKKHGTKTAGLFSLGILGLILILGNCATATSEWFEVTYNDFNDSDTISNLEIKAEGPNDIGRVHLEDNSSESHSNIYNDPTSYKILCHDENVNPMKMYEYSQSFYPTIDGVVDHVEVMIYYVGDPEHTNEDQSTSVAKVTIDIEYANQNTKFPSGGAPQSIRTVNYQFFPSQSGTWTTFWFSFSDSCGNGTTSQFALTNSNYYTLHISSDADWDSTHANEIRIEYKEANNPNTVCGERTFDQQGNPVWAAMDFDFPFNITVHNFVDSGYLISDAFNTNNPGTTLSSILWSTDNLGGGRAINIYTRGGDTPSPDETWSSWLDQTSYWGSLNPYTPSPHGQYIQYKLELSTTDTCFTPYFDAVWIYYN